MRPSPYTGSGFPASAVAQLAALNIESLSLGDLGDAPALDLGGFKHLRHLTVNALRAPKTRFEVRDEMVHDPHYQMFSTLLRTSQEMMWSSCQKPVQRDLESLNKTINKRRKKALGSLRLDPALQTPKYHLAVDIHCQPGGYHTEFAPEDASAGMVYDRAVHVYAMGQMGPYNNDMGASIVLWLQRNHPDFKPKRIMDLGGGIGGREIPGRPQLIQGSIQIRDF